MGRSKGALQFGSTTLLERIVSALRHEFCDIVIVAAPEKIDPFPDNIPGALILRDETPHAGPVLALERGLKAARNDIVFACSCDLPMLNAGLARELCRMMADYDAVIPEVGGRLQVLHAAYRTRCAQALAEMRSRGEVHLREIIRALKARVVAESEIRSLDPEFSSFLNVNTPADYERALRLAGAS